LIEVAEPEQQRKVIDPVEAFRTSVKGGVT
jgi:hypothetical protein